MKSPLRLGLAPIALRIKGIFAEESAALLLRASVRVLAVTIVCGCDRPPSYRTKLAQNERVAEGRPVLLDESEVGRVKAINIERGERVAVFVVTDKEVANKTLRQGTLRVVSDDDQIHLRTDGVDSQSPVLRSGATIPVISKTEFAVNRLTSQRAVRGLLVYVAIVAVVLLLFRCLARGWLILLTLVLSAASAWVLLPWTTNVVLKGYSLLPQSSAASANIQPGFFRFIEHAPNPQVVAYAVVFVAAFIVVSVLLRGAISRLESRG